MPRVAPKPRGPRNSVNDRPAWWKLLLRRQRRLLRPAALGFVFCIAGLAVIGMFRAGTSGNSVTTVRERVGEATAYAGLRVTDIQVEGLANTPEPLLRAAIGVSKGDPILGFSVEEARQRIAKLNWIEHATVERRLPGTVVVYLQERRPFAVWQNQGKFVLVDRAGLTVANQDLSHFRHLPLIVGPGAPAAAAPLLDVLRDKPALSTRVVGAVRVGERRWNLRLNNGTDVMLPEDNEVAAIDRLLNLQQTHALMDRPLAVIDMRLADKLVLRPRADAKANEPRTNADPTGRSANVLPAFVTPTLGTPALGIPTPATQPRHKPT